jgi:phosphoribosylanthranilate isomerase
LWFTFFRFLKMTENACPRIKICGLTRVDEAVGCAELGANAIGLVFFPGSPRHVTDEQALAISTAVSNRAKRVGVFVNATSEEILRKVEFCRLSAVQLHGQESPELVNRLVDREISVIKALFADGRPALSEAKNYAASAFLVECSKGPLPGGNAMAWDWGAVKPFGENHPLILAGGLSPENVLQAVSSAHPHAVDVSSGVESSPGRKDLKRVAAFIGAVSNCHVENRGIKEKEFIF